MLQRHDVYYNSNIKDEPEAESHNTGRKSSKKEQ